MRPVMAIAVLLGLVFAAPMASAKLASKATGADICVQSAQQASVETGVPLSVLLAISLTETGRKKDGKFSPWPWTVNMEGVGKWFDQRENALKFALGNFDRGARSFDIGCFQINYRWHGKNFTSIENMFDPMANARYAARYLLDLFAEKGNWNAAAGAYHSRTQLYAARYSKRFARIHASLENGNLPAFEFQTLPEPRTNRFPLLVASEAEAIAFGSLFRDISRAKPDALIRAGTGRLF